MTMQNIEMNATTANEIARKLNALLKQFGEENGLVVGKLDGKFSSNGSIDFKFGLTTANSNPSGVDPRYLKDLRARGWNHGLTESMIGTKFQSNGDSVEFLGMRASKVVGRKDGKEYLFNAEAVSPRIIANAQR